MMLRKVPEELGYSKQELALLRECLLELLRVQDGYFGVCGTLDDMLSVAAADKLYYVHADGYAFCNYAAYSWGPAMLHGDGEISAYFIPDAGALWSGRGLELRIDFMQHCLGVVAKLESELP